MTKRYSIAEARHYLRAVVHELEWRARIELTRRGRPVALMLSMRTASTEAKSRRFKV